MEGESIEDNRMTIQIRVPVGGFAMALFTSYHSSTLVPAKPSSIVTEHFNALESDVVHSAAIEYRSGTQK